MNLYPNIEHVLDQWNEDWADVLLLTNIEEDEAIMYTLVDPVTKKMHSSNDFKLYNKKHIWEKVLTLAELNAIQSNPASAANYVFFDDKIYRDLFINNFQLEMFASWAIADLQVRAYAQYDEALQREQLETKVLWDENIYTFTLNF